MPGTGSDQNSAYALFRVEASTYEIERDGRTIGRLSRDRWGWVAEPFVHDAFATLAPFAKREHRFPMLINALIWLGHPPRGERAAAALARPTAVRRPPIAVRPEKLSPFPAK